MINKTAAQTNTNKGIIHANELSIKLSSLGSETLKSIYIYYSKSKMLQTARQPRSTLEPYATVKGAIEI